MTNALLAALADRQHFIVYRASDKNPINPAHPDPASEYARIDAQDPQYWMTPGVAEGWVAMLGAGFGVGVVIYEGSGLLCVDVDHCALPEGGWSQTAIDLCNRFAGAAVEISLSRQGLHIFAWYRGPAPPHRKKNKQLGIEFYTSGRYIALTGYGLTGSIAFDATDLLPAFTAEYFPPTANDDDGGEWHSASPYEDYQPFKDDAALLAAALKSRSAGAIFGDKASFADLWYANVDALACVFPPNPNSSSPYDASSADQALANHLSFWCGGNHEHVASLMRLSGLVRNKWDREDYFNNTVSNAVAWTRDYPKRRSSLSPVPAPPITTIAPQIETPQQPGALDATANLGTGAKLNGSTPPPPLTPDTVPDGYVTRPGEVLNIPMMRQQWAGYAYVQDINAIFLPPPRAWTLTRERFDIMHGGRQFAMTPDGQKPTDSAWEAFTMNGAHDFPKVEGLYFEPREAPGKTMTKDHRTVINSWMPVEIEMTPGDPAPFVDHVHKIFPSGNDAMILIYYLACIVQFKGVKSKWAPLLQGVEGNGKSLLSAIMKRSLGRRYSHDAKASQIDSKFNASFYGKLLVVVEEIQISEDKGSVWESLKTMITEETLEIEAKGVDKVTREVCFNFIFNSNHKDAIRKSANDRRVAPFFAAQQSVADLIRDGMLDDDGNSKYFDKLFDWLDAGGYAIVAHYLATVSIPDQYNFSTRCKRAPRTSSTELSIEVSLGGAEQEIIEASSAGIDGFANGWVNSVELDRLLERTGKAKYLSRTKRREMMYSLGYIWHPGLPEGRVTMLINGARPRLYVKRGHLTGNMKGNDVTAAYLAAQKAAR